MNYDWQITRFIYSKFFFNWFISFFHFFVFVYQKFGLKKEFNNQKDEINKYQETQGQLNQKVNEIGTDGIIADIITVTQSFAKYGLIVLGKNSKITSQFKAGDKIYVKYENKKYTGKVHNTVVGRIDGLTAMYRDNVELKNKSTMEIVYNEHDGYIIVKG